MEILTLNVTVFAGRALEWYLGLDEVTIWNTRNMMSVPIRERDQGILPVHHAKAQQEDSSLQAGKRILPGTKSVGPTLTLDSPASTTEKYVSCLSHLLCCILFYEPERTNTVHKYKIHFHNILPSLNGLISI